MTRAVNIFGKNAALAFVEKNAPDNRKECLYAAIRAATVSDLDGQLSEHMLTIPGFCVADVLYTLHIKESGNIYIANTRYAVKVLATTELYCLTRMEDRRIAAVPHFGDMEKFFPVSYQAVLNTQTLPTIPLQITQQSLRYALRQAQAIRGDLREYIDERYLRNAAMYDALRARYTNVIKDESPEGWIQTISLTDGPISYIIKSDNETGEFQISFYTVDHANDVKELLNKKPLNQ